VDHKVYTKNYQDRAKAAREDGRPQEVVYLAGPIDHSTGMDPDARHDLLETFLDGGILIYCPLCVQRYERSAPQVMMRRNMGALGASDSMIVVWDGPVEQPSFGVPLEIYLYAAQDADRLVVVGSLGNGMVANAIRAAGVREVGTMSEAVDLLWP